MNHDQKEDFLPMNYDQKSYQSDQVSELFTALSKAQGEMLPALKDSANPYFKSKYADLSSIWEVCRPVLANNGLSIIQTTIPCQEVLVGDKVKYSSILVTTLAHASGQYIKSYTPIICQKEDIQSYGAALTYIRRYSLAAIMGVSQEDDDGEKAMQRTKPKSDSKKEEDSITEFMETLDDDYRRYFRTYIHNICKTAGALPTEMIERIKQDETKFYVHFNNWIEKTLTEG